MGYLTIYVIKWDFCFIFVAVLYLGMCKGTSLFKANDSSNIITDQKEHIKEDVEWSFFRAT